MAESEQKAGRFGDICIEKGFITREQLEAALEDQRVLAQRGMKQTVGDILVSKGQLTNEQRNAALRVMQLQSGEAHRVGDFEVVSKLGAGAFGVVYKARSRETGQEVALKVLPPELARNQEYVERFLREVGVLQTLDHPNIVGCVDVGFDEKRKTYYCAMEFVDGETVAALIEKYGVLEEAKALDIVYQVTQGLQHAVYHGMIHRDIKPSNIMVTRDGVAKLVDFGLARGRDVTEGQLTMTGFFVGTPSYASPEQARGEKALDIRTDIYSLGASLYHMVTGEPPYTGTPAELLVKHITEELPWPGDVNPDLSEGVCRLIEKMMAKDPNDRYANPKELLGDIMTVKAGGAPSAVTLAPGRSTINRDVKPAARPRRSLRQPGTALKRVQGGEIKLIYAGLAVVAVAMLGSAAYWLSWGTKEPELPPPKPTYIDERLAPPGPTKAPPKAAQPSARPFELVYENGFEAGDAYELIGWTTVPQSNTGVRAVSARGAGKVVLRPGKDVGLGFSVAVAYMSLRPASLEVKVQTTEGTATTGETWVSGGDWRAVVFQSIEMKGKAGGTIKSVEISGDNAPEAAFTIDDVRVFAGYDREKILAYYNVSAAALPASQPAVMSEPGGAWRPIFDGKTVSGLKWEISGSWQVVDGALENVPGKYESPQTTEQFEDGQVRVVFEAAGHEHLEFAVRQGEKGKYAVSFSRNNPAAGKRHEIIFTCKGDDVTATLDGAPCPLTTRPLAPIRRGALQFGAMGGKMRIYSIDYRPLSPGTAPTAMPTATPVEVVTWQGHRYALYKQSARWQDAKRFCEAQGGHLVTVTSREENDVVTALARKYDVSAFIGITDEREEGRWEWVTGEPVGFTAWGEGEPNNSNNEDYGGLYQWKDFAWNDFNNEAVHPFICEWEAARPAIAPPGLETSRIGNEPWQPLYDGKTLSFLSGDGRGAWRIVDGAIENVPGTRDAANTRRLFRDGMIRVIFDVADHESLYFAMRSGAAEAYKARWGRNSPAAGVRHELIFLCNAENVSATLDGQPVNISKPPAPVLEGSLQFNVTGGKLRVYSIDYRPLMPTTAAAPPPAQPQTTENPVITDPAKQHYEAAETLAKSQQYIAGELFDKLQLLTGMPYANTPYGAKAKELAARLRATVFPEHWWVVKGFPNAEDWSGTDRVFEPENTPFNAGQVFRVGNADCGWQKIKTGANGYVDLLPGTWQCAYAYAVIESPTAQEAVFFIGSDDTAKMWLNGQIIYRFGTHRPWKRWEDSARGALKAGTNTVLVKVCQGTGNWGFSLDAGTPRDIVFFTPSPAAAPPVESSQSFDALLGEVHALLKAGEFVVARERIDIASRDAAFAVHESKLKSAGNVADAFAGQRASAMGALKKSIGQRVSLETFQGVRTGELVRVGNDDLTLALDVPVPTPRRVSWMDMTLPERARLAEGWKPAGADGAMARAYVALSVKDYGGVEKALGEAGGHPLAPLLRKDLDAEKPAVKPAPIAKPAPPAPPPPPKKPWPPDAEAVQKLFRGKVHRFEAARFWLELGYNFADAVQLEDWTLSEWVSPVGADGSVTIKDEALRLTGSGRYAFQKGRFTGATVRVARFAVVDGGKGGAVATMCCIDGKGNFYALDGIYDKRLARLEKAVAGKRGMLDAFVYYSPCANEQAGFMELKWRRGRIEGSVGGIAGEQFFEADDQALISGHPGLWAEGCDVIFDSISICGYIDKEWLRDAMLKAGIIKPEDADIPSGR